MPVTHDYGVDNKYFIQFLRFPVKWGAKVWVRGWTQEIEEPFRTSEPIIVRLPRHRALAFGRWTGQLPEEEALNRAIQRRDLTDNDFHEDKGWTPAPDSAGEADSGYPDL
jgi:hypothetical protein